MELTPELIRSLAENYKYGSSLDDLANILKISRTKFDKLRKTNDALEQELLKARSEAKAQMAKNIFQKALEGNATLAIFWAKTQMGWKEEAPIQVQTNEGKLVIDLSGKNLPE